MKITTNISSQRGNQHYIRGKKLVDLIEHATFSQTLFLLWRGNMPQRKEEKLLDAILVSAAEHGANVPSLYVPRVAASVGNPMHTALAAGLLSIGNHHGGAIEPAAKLLFQIKDTEKTVTTYLRKRKPIPGFGHRMYKTKDPRAQAIYTKAKKLKFSCRYFEKAYAIEKELKKQKGKNIPLNIDGAMAAALLELSFDWRFAEAMFLVARIAGMAAHVVEEKQQNNPYYRL